MEEGVEKVLQAHVCNVDSMGIEHMNVQSIEMKVEDKMQEHK
jgi:hypothetical protein